MMEKCEIENCQKKAIGKILLCVTINEPYYINVCKKHLAIRQKISPDSKPLIEGYPQWKKEAKKPRN